MKIYFGFRFFFSLILRYVKSYFSSGVCAGLRKIASSSIFVALSLVESTGKGGGDKLRPVGIFGAFIDIPEFSPENIGRDILLCLGSLAVDN